MQAWMRIRRLAAVAAIGVAGVLLAVPPAGAQTTADQPPLATVRGFGDVGYEWFAAKQTFNAVFGQSTGDLVGGGAQLVFRDGLYFQFGVSRFQKTGQRVFDYNGQSYGLGIPLTATLTPIEFTGGYRRHLSPRIVLYGGAGVGTTSYKETSQGVDASQNVDTRHTSYQVEAGGEYRLTRWFGVAGGVEYNRIPGIIGTSGVSKDFGENNLGGTSLHIRFIVGR
jgi:opacity protein-like surface antigen